MAGLAYALTNNLQFNNVNIFAGTGNVAMVNEGAVVLIKTVGAATQVSLRPSPDLGNFCYVKDGKGDAATNNITIVDPNGNTIDGQASYVIASNYGSAVFMWNGIEWSLITEINVILEIPTAVIDTLSLGKSGTAGTLNVFPSTASKGNLEVTVSPAAGNTVTNINVAAQGGARTLTVPDPGASANFLLSAQAEGANGMFAMPLPMLGWKNAAGTNLAAAASAGEFGMTITLGTGSYLIGEAANTNTKTDDAIAEFVLPPTYIAGQNLTVTVNAQIAGAGTPGTKTVQIKAYRVASNGTQGSNIGPGSASAITAGGADVPFTITGTTLNPGDRVMLELEVVLQETGGTNINAQVNSVRVS